MPSNRMRRAGQPWPAINSGKSTIDHGMTRNRSSLRLEQMVRIGLAARLAVLVQVVLLSQVAERESK
jgi:hypothetical protein